MTTCTVIGILDDGWAGLSDAARTRLRAAGIVIGVGRTLELVRHHLAPAAIVRDMDGALPRVPEWTKSALADGLPVVILVTGDPFCHGLGAWLDGRLETPLDILPAVSTLQLACARLRIAWHDARIASCHGKDGGEWFAGASPEHPLYPALRAIARHPKVLLFTSPENGPARLARALQTAGYGDDEIRLSVACRLQMADEQLFRALPLSAATQGDFPTPNVVLVEWMNRSAQSTPVFGLSDDEFIQRAPEKGLITKQEVRALSLAKLRLREDAVVWDIGAGSGSVGLEAARLAPAGHVWAIEKNAEDAANARANARRLRSTNYTLVEGKAPCHLDAWPDPDAVFIGGSGGELAALIDLIFKRLKPGGRLVMNFVTLENLATATAALTAADATWDVVQLQASRSQPILDMHRMAAQNPVWVITASTPPTPLVSGEAHRGDMRVPSEAQAGTADAFGVSIQQATP